MSKSQLYNDVASVVNVIGNIYNYPEIFNREDKYFFSEDDFPNRLHKTIFGAMYNLYQRGVTKITLNAIEDYLEKRPKLYGEYTANKGAEYIQACAENSSIDTFDYYYNRLKKMTLLREYSKIGMDLSWLYDVDNLLDAKKKQRQEDWLDNTSLDQIANAIDDKILKTRMKYVDNNMNEAVDIGKDLNTLVDRLMESPEIGYPLFGNYINTVTRGARLGKLYLRSAATGVGKTRSMIADCCTIGCDRMWDAESRNWIFLGTAQDVLFISTEQTIDEIQTMALAFISGVEEEHILYGSYGEGEWERIEKSIEILKKSKIHFESMPDFSLADVENTIKRGIHEFNLQYIFLDYIHTSMRILEEISKKSGGVKLREDNILYMMAIRIKDICTQYGVFILTATQLNMSYQDNVLDQNALRGAKAIADKIDLGITMVQTTKADEEALMPILHNLGITMPRIKMYIYKNRRGRWKDVILWCSDRRGLCQINPEFVTDANYEYIEMENIRIEV